MAKKSSGTKNPATRRAGSMNGLPIFAHDTGSTANLSALAGAVAPQGTVSGGRQRPVGDLSALLARPTGGNIAAGGFTSSIPMGGAQGTMNPLDAYAAEMQAAQDAAKQANEQRYLDILSELSGQRGDSADRLMAAMEAMDQRFDTNARDMDTLFKTARKDTGKRYGERTKQATGRADASKKELDARYGQRLEGALARLRGAGEREAADIRGASKAADSAMAQNLVNRGFGNAAGLQESLRMGLGRERNADLARLGERLRGEEQNVFGRMTGERLSAAERGNMAGLNAYMQASGDEAGALGNLDAGQIAAMERLMGNQTMAAERGMGRYNDALSRIDERFVNTMENRTDSYPDFGPLLQAAQMAGMGGGFNQQGNTMPKGQQGTAQMTIAPKAPASASSGRMQNAPGAPPRKAPPKPYDPFGQGGTAMGAPGSRGNVREMVGTGGMPSGAQTFAPTGPMPPLGRPGSPMGRLGASRRY